MTPRRGSKRGGALALLAVIAACVWGCGDQSPTDQPAQKSWQDWHVRDPVYAFGPGPNPISLHPWSVELIDERELPAMTPAPRETLTPEDLLDPESELLEWVTIERQVFDPRGEPLPSATAWVVPEGRVLAALGLRTPSVLTRQYVLGGPAQPLLELPRAPGTPFRADTSGRVRFTAPAYQRLGPNDSWFWATRRPTPHWAVVVVDAPGFATHVKWIFPASLGGVDAPGATIDPIHLAPAARFAGRLVDEQARPIADGELRVVWASQGELAASLPGVHHVSTDATGAFVLASLRAWTSYRLDVRAPGFVRREVKINTSGADEPLVPETITLMSARQLTGSVRTADGRLAPDARVFAYPSGDRTSAISDVDSAWFSPGDDVVGLEQYVEDLPEAVRAEIDGDGRFTLDVARDEPPTFTVSAAAPGYEMAVRLDVAADTHDLELLLRPASRLLVELVDTLSSEPVAPTSFFAGRFIGPGHNISLKLPTRQLAPNRWLVEGVGPNGTFLYAGIRYAPDRRPRNHFSLIAGQPVGSVARATVRVPRIATLTGQLVGGPWPESDRPSIWAARVRDGAEPIRGNGESARLDAEGRFGIERILAHRLLVGHVGEGHADCPKVAVDVSMGGSHTVTLDCTRPAPPRDDD